MNHDDSAPMKKYREMVDRLAEMRTKNRGLYSQDEGSLLEDMTAAWLELSEHEITIAEWLVEKVPTVPTPTESRRTLDSAFMLPSFKHEALMMGVGAR